MSTETNSLLVVVLFLVGCAPTAVDSVTVPPDTIPRNSEWRGGLDGGNWVHCEKTNDIYRCSTYWRSGELYSQQLFQLCGALEPTKMFDGHNLSGVVSVNVRSGSVQFVPYESAIVFKDGSPDEDLTEKSAQEFSNSNHEECGVELVVKSRGGELHSIPSD